MFYKLEMPLNDTNSFIFNYQERLCSEYPFITLGWWSIAHLDLTRKLLSKTLAGCKIFIEDISGDTANALLPILQKSKSSSDIGSEYPDLTKKKQVDFAHDDKSVLPNTSDNQSSIDDLSLRVPSKAHALNTEEKKSSSRKDVNNDLLTSEGKSDIEGDDDAMNPTTLSAEMQAVTDEYLQKKTSTILQGRQPTLLFGYFGSLVALQNKRQPQ